MKYKGDFRLGGPQENKTKIKVYCLLSRSKRFRNRNEGFNYIMMETTTRYRHQWCSERDDIVDNAMGKMNDNVKMKL